MNKSEGTKEFIKELEENNKIEILQGIDAEQYENIRQKEGGRASDFVKAMKREGFSEFTIGVAVGMNAKHIEEKIKTGTGWRKYIPELLK